MKTKIILVLILAALLFVLLIQNTAIITYRLYFWTISISQIILVPLVALAGFLLGYILGSLRKTGKEKSHEKDIQAS